MLLIWTLFVLLVPAAAQEGDGSCAAGSGESCSASSDTTDEVDKYDTGECISWAKRCECESNPGFMHKSCAKSCAIYGSEPCKNREENCRGIIGKVKVGTRCSDAQWDVCALTCHKMHKASEKHKKEKEKDKGTGRSGKKCERIHIPGGLHNRSISEMFGRIADEGWAAYHKPTVLSRDPWIIYFDQLVTPEQVDALMQGMQDLGATYSKSTELSSSGSEQRRTSDSLHCPNPRCFEDPRLLTVHEAITNVTGLGLLGHELPQITRYAGGQFYVQHQDTSDEYARAAHGNRIYTMFTYLSDVPEGSEGETAFPKLKIKVKPKKGAAVLWANVKADDPRKVDPRTMHEARPLKKGMLNADGTEAIKLASNFWLYGYDWRTQWKTGCMNVAAGY